MSVGAIKRDKSHYTLFFFKTVYYISEKFIFIYFRDIDDLHIIVLLDFSAGCYFLRNSAKVSIAKNSIAKNKLNIARKMSTCRAPLLGTCRI